MRHYFISQRCFFFAAVLVVSTACPSWCLPLRAQDKPAADAIERDYPTAIVPLLKRYCYECHSKDVTEADVDLAVFANVADVQKQAKVWVKVRHMLDTRQMPPKDARQPSDSEHRRMQNWVRDMLAREAKKRAGDPGPVVLRRLSNAEYNYTIADLTGIDSLDPTAEFPVDGASGEGFTNTGSGQGMSPALVQKYLDAAKQVAGHMLLLPDGIRFSPYTTRRDQTDELLAKIQAFYRRFTADGGGTAINLHGIKFTTNQGGLLPLDKYLEATLAERDTIRSGKISIDQVADQRRLNARYLTTLWKTLSDETGNNTSPLFDSLREKWRQAAPGNTTALAAEIKQAQQKLWKFNSIGHIGRTGGPKSWLEAVSPVTRRQEIRYKLPAASGDQDVVIYLAASDLADGNEHDFVVWQRPRIEFNTAKSAATIRPILLRDIRLGAQQIEQIVAAQSARTRQYLAAAVRLKSSSKPVEEVAKSGGLNSQLLKRWDALLMLGQRSKRQVTGHFTTKLTKVQGYEAINGWGSHQTPSLLTNRSDKPISFLTLTVPARGVTVHPSPTLESIVSWQSPIDTQLSIAGLVADADNKCGNGAAWRLELLSTAGKSVLASGIIDNGRKQSLKSDKIHVSKGDVISLVVNARDKSHACDTTHIELKLSEVGGMRRVWNLASDIVDNVLQGNPLPDAYGNDAVWHFCTSSGAVQKQSLIPPGSALAHWRAAVMNAKPAAEIDKLAVAVENVLTTKDATMLSGSDKKLRQLLLDWKGPLGWISVGGSMPSDAKSPYGLDASMFGKHPNGKPLAATDICLQAPRVLEVRLPARLVAGGEFVATAVMHAETGKQGSVQLQVTADKPKPPAVSAAQPILVGAGEQASRRVEAALKQYRDLFPPALCYARIVPVDEVVTLTLYHREDDHLKRLMLDERQSAQLDRLWDELLYVSREPLKLEVAFEQIYEFATQDRPDLVKAFVPLRKPIGKRAEAFRERLLKTEPAHIDAVVRFADRAWRRPLTAIEQNNLRDLYSRLRKSEIPHEQAIRLMLARVLSSPAFLYKLEQPAPDKRAAPVSDWELAVRLSYFLGSSLPDEQLRAAAQAGKLSDENQLIAQTRRLLKEGHTRRLAIHFACQWLHLRDFDKNDDKNEKRFPQFAQRRSDMYEETVRFFEDMFRKNGSILDFVDADHTFVNQSLARHYGIDGVSGDRWQRIEDVRKKGRGGILGMATFLASQSGASRTSPILRGNWVSETLLGEKLPKPPAGVPILPDEVPAGLTARQLIEKHSGVPACAKCHAKIDPYGFALEQYDAIGRLRSTSVDTKTTLFDGKKIEGIAGLRGYLANDRREDVVRQFSRKLLGYALGRELQLSDEPLLDTIVSRLAKSEYRFLTAVETIVVSPQFRQIRGRQQPIE